MGPTRETHVIQVLFSKMKLPHVKALFAFSTILIPQIAKAMYVVPFYPVIPIVPVFPHPYHPHRIPYSVQQFPYHPQQTLRPYQCKQLLKSLYNSETPTDFEKSYPLGTLPPLGTACQHQGKTPLIVSVLINRPEWTSYLIRMGSDVNFNPKNSQGGALHIIARLGWLQQADQMLRRGADPNKIDGKENGQSALHYAVLYDQLEMAELLIRHGARVNQKDVNGQTVLHYAARKGDREMIESLRQAGAQSSFKDKKGRTPGDLAPDEVVKALVNLPVEI